MPHCNSQKEAKQEYMVSPPRLLCRLMVRPSKCTTRKLDMYVQSWDKIDRSVASVRHGLDEYLELGIEEIYNAFLLPLYLSKMSIKYVVIESCCITLFFPRLSVLLVQFLAFGVIIVIITPRTDHFCPMAVHT